MNLDKVKITDPEVAGYIEEELERQQNTIELIASENFTSPAVMQACGSVLTNKYAEGKPHKRYYNGCEVVDKIEELAQKRACELFNMAHANVQPHSGAQANMAVFSAFLKSGDRVLGMDLSNGGFGSTSDYVEFESLEPLSGLTNLTSLTLRNKHISDLSPLSGLTNLQSLTLHNAGSVTDVSPLSALPDLKSLTISGTWREIDTSSLSQVSIIHID